MLRFICTLSAAALLAQATNVTAKPKGKHGGDRLAMLFKKIDTNGDGKVSKEEFERFAETIRKKVGTTKAQGKGGTGEMLFGKLDANGDGKLSLDEFKKISELRKNKNK